MAETQSYAKHARWDPMFHFFLVPASALLLIAMVYHIYKAQHSGVEIWMVAWLLVFIVGVFKMRLYALRNQDRIIRLEEQVRLRGLVPEALRARLAELSTDQLIGLRFASDREAAALCERALNEKLSRDAIKQAVQEWRADQIRI